MENNNAQEGRNNFYLSLNVKQKRKTEIYRHSNTSIEYIDNSFPAVPINVFYNTCNVYCVSLHHIHIILYVLYYMH